ncbi:MAG: hypothetical protein LUE29_02270 [Lachnospiraceae bacterium]|nr:hypothetical protein [Lachnospiraceae bacterium]
MKRKMPKVLLAFALVCALTLGTVVASFAADVAENTEYQDGQVIDGSTGWNTADGDNYLITYNGTVVKFTNDPFIRDEENWSNFVFETVSSEEADGITLRADAYGWTYGDGVNTPWYNVDYNWDWDDFNAICTENTEITLIAYLYDDWEVDFIIEFGNSGYYLKYYVCYDEGVPAELWFHLGSDGGKVTVNSVEYIEPQEIESVSVDYLETTEYICDSSLNLDGTEVTVTYANGLEEILTLKNGYAMDSYGNTFRAYLVIYYEDWDYDESFWDGSTLYNAGTGTLWLSVSDLHGEYVADIETTAEITVKELELSDILEAGVTELELDVTYETDIAEEGAWVWYSFTPETSGYYVFKSFNNEIDSYVELYVSYDGEEIYYCASDDDSAGEGNNFLLKYYMEEGVTYYYKARAWSDSYVGIYEVTLTEGKAITSISVGDLSQAEFVQYVDYFNFTGTVVTVTYEDDTTAEVVVDYRTAVDAYGNYIYCYVMYKGSSYSQVRMPAGEYTVTFYTDDWSATDESKTVSVIAIEDYESYCDAELLDTEYSVEAESETAAWFAFTPEEDGYYYFVFNVDSDAYSIGWWTDSVTYFYYESEDEENDEYGYVYRGWASEAYDEDGNWMYVEYGDYTQNVYEMTAGVTYYIPCWYYGYTEEYELADAATMTMLVGQVGHEHSYTAENITWIWSEDHLSATASLRCDTCSEALTGTAEVTTVTTEATETTDGSIVYTATVTLNGNVYTNTYTETIPATGETTTTEATETTTTEADETTTEADETTEASTTATSSDADPDGTNSTGSTGPNTGDVATWGYYVLLLGAAAVAAVLAKKKVNA